MSPYATERFELLDRVWNQQCPARQLVLQQAKMFVDSIPAELEGYQITGENDSIVLGWFNLNQPMAATVVFSKDVESLLQVAQRKDSSNFEGIAAARISPFGLTPIAVNMIKFVLEATSEVS